MAITFDTLRASKQLRDVGFAEDQAEAIVTTIADGVPDDIATKDDLVSLGQRLTIRLFAVIGGATGVLLAGMAIAAAVILEAN